MKVKIGTSLECSRTSESKKFDDLVRLRPSKVNNFFLTLLTWIQRTIVLFLIYTFFFINLLIYLFIFGCIGSSLLCAGFSLAAVSGGYSSLRCVGFSLQWLLLLQSVGSRHTGFSSCGTQAQQLWLAASRAQAQ